MTYIPYLGTFFFSRCYPSAWPWPLINSIPRRYYASINYVVTGPQHPPACASPPKPPQPPPAVAPWAQPTGRTAAAACGGG